ncbi:MAG: hypothetical protein ACYTG4_12680 [Planctomycetota bacterium]
MRTGTLVFSLTAAGALGGVVGAFHVGGDREPVKTDDPVPMARAAASSEASKGELDEMHARIEALEANLTANAREVTDLRGALEEEKAANKDLIARLDSVESSASNSPTARTLAPGAQFESPTIHFGGVVGDKWKKVRELRKLKTDEERWQKTREALGLTLQQETELKAALEERKKAMKDAFAAAKTETVGDGTSFTVSMPDPKAMKAARDNYEERVDSALNAEQAKKWRDDGYENAMGGGGGTSMSFMTIGGSDRESK